MAVEARDIGGASLRQGGASRRISWWRFLAGLSILASVVLWLMGLGFTAAIMEPMAGLSALQAAIAVQVVLTVTQMAWRIDKQSTGAIGLFFVVIDVLINAAGMLVAFGAIDAPVDAVDWLIASVVDASGMVMAALWLSTAIAVAVAPETFIRTALKFWKRG
jgi:hypothetical protein